MISKIHFHFFPPPCHQLAMHEKNDLFLSPHTNSIPYCFRSQSAFVLSSTSSLSTQYDMDSMQSCSAERPADCSLLKWNWFPGQHQHVVPPLRTFKPGRSTNNIVAQEEVQKLSDSNSHFTGIFFFKPFINLFWN